MILSILGYMIEAYAKTQWTEIFVANHTFTGTPGLIKMYILEAIPTLIVYMTLGVVLYSTAKREDHSAYWIIGIAFVVTGLTIFSTQWGFSGQVTWIRKAFEYSKTLLPMVFLLSGTAIAKTIENPPNKAL